MHTSSKTSRARRAVLGGLLASLFVSAPGFGAGDAGMSIVPVLQDRFGLDEQQIRGALGALLVYVRERLPKPDFDELAQTIPNADRIMQEVKQRGIVTAPLDNSDDFEATLANVGIGQPLAAQFAPAVIAALKETGHERQSQILTRAIT